MYLFTRQTTLGGDLAAGSEWAVRIGAHASAVTGVDVSTWATWFGAPLGTVTWSAWVDSLDGLSTLAAVETDPGYLALVQEGQAFAAAPHVMNMRSPLSAMPVERRELPIGAVATITSAVASGGKLSAAMAWGSEIATYASEVSGQPIAFFVDAFGTFGQLTWIGVADDAKGADAANDKLNTDAGYMERLAGSSGVFVEGSGVRMMSIRIG